jgi:hypothetical protein
MLPKPAQDAPDDYPWLPGSKRTVVADLGELAARMGSPVTYDRRGEVVYFEDMRHGLNDIDFISAGFGATYAITADHGLTSGYTLAISTSALDGSFVSWSNYHNIVTSETVGIEECFMAYKKFKYHSLFGYTDTGVNMLAPAIRLNGVTKTLEYQNDTGAWTVIHTFGYYPYGSYHHHHLKLVYNIISKKYMRFMFDDLEIDMTGFGFLVGVTQGHPGIYANVGHTVSDAQVNALYHNHLVITLNEP